MRQLQFNDYEQFTCKIVDKFDSLEDEYATVSIIAKYEEAKKIIKELLYIGYDIASIDLHNEEFENYYNEYIISLNFDGVWCEKFKRDTGYFSDESNVIYIMDNCSSAVIPHCNSKNLYEVFVGENEDKLSNTDNYTQNSKSIYISRSKDGTPEGFTKSWIIVRDDMTCHSSYSYYSDNINMLRKIASDFGVKL